MWTRVLSTQTLHNGWWAQWARKSKYKLGQRESERDWGRERERKRARERDRERETGRQKKRVNEGERQRKEEGIEIEYLNGRAPLLLSQTLTFSFVFCKIFYNIYILY